MLDQVDPERMEYFCKKIMENEKISESNGKLWSFSLDSQLKELVILYNFNFYEVVNRFHYFMSEGKKYEYTEDEIRRHWAFIHAARYLNVTIDEEYYDVFRAKYKVLEIKRRKVDPEEEKHRIAEEDRIKKEIEKMRYERFNLITVGPEEENKDKTNEKEDVKNIEEKGNEVEVTTEEKIKEEDKNNGKDKNISINGTSPHAQEVTSSQSPQEKNTLPNNEYEEDEDEDEVINSLFKNAKNLDANIYNNAVNIDTDNKLYNLESNEDNYDKDLFPIKTQQNFFISNEDATPIPTNEHDSSFTHAHSNYTHEGIDKDIEKTKNIDDFINQDTKLKEQYDNLNTYYNFAVKSLNYFIPKLGNGLKKEESNEGENINSSDNNDLALQKDSQNLPDPFEAKVIKKTSEKINELFFNSMKEASEKLALMGAEEYNKRLDEEEQNMDADLLNKKKMLANLHVEEPDETDQEQKMAKFRTYLFTEANKVSTPELLSKIVDIINTTYIDEVKVRNEGEEEEEDKKEETALTTMTDGNNADITITTQTDKEENKKYKYYYRGVEYYTDKPPKEVNSDDSYVEDD